MRLKMEKRLEESREVIVQRLLKEEMRHVFLAELLVEQTRSQMEGLFQRYPMVWKNRPKENPTVHQRLSDSNFKNSFIMSYSYLFLVESQTNEEMQQEIIQILRKIRPLYARKLKGCRTVIPFSFMEGLSGDKHFKNTIETIKELSILDYWMNAKGLSMALSPEFYRHYQKQFKLVETAFYRNMIDGTTVFSSEEEKKQVLEKLKQFEAGISQSFASYLKACWHQIVNDRAYEKTLLSEGLGLFLYPYLTFFVPTLSLKENELHLIFMNILFCLENQPEIEEINADESRWISEIQALIPYALIQALTVKLIEDNRKQFFDSIQVKEVALARQLEKENKSLAKELMGAKKDHKKMVREVNQLELKTKKTVKEAVATERALSLTLERRVNRLQTENEALKEQLEQMKRQLETLQSEKEEAQEMIEELMANDEACLDEQLAIFNHPSVLFVGGFPSVMERLRGMLPSCKYFECGESVNDDFFTGVQRIYLMKRYVNHGMMNQVIKNVPQAPIYEVPYSNLKRIVQVMMDSAEKTNERKKEDLTA